MDGVARRARLARSRLYLVVDDRPEALDGALRGGVDVVELSAPDLADDEVVRAAEAVRRACDEHEALFVLADRAHLVERTGADGVRVAAAVADARRGAGGERIVGASATPTELATDAEYVVAGSSDAPMDLGFVREARDTLRLPWFAVGSPADALALHGAPGIAVDTSFLLAGDAERGARALRALLPPSSVVVSHGDPVSLPHVDWLPSTRSAGQKPVAPHTHAAHTDVFFLLDGTLEFRVGDGTARMPAGSAVAAPRLLVHGFRHPGGDATRFLNLHAPGVWARGQAGGLPKEQHDQFGPERASKTARPIAVAPGDGDRLTKPHRLALLKVDTPDIALLEYVVGDGYDGASAHVHLRHTDCFHVLEGTLEFEADGRRIRADAGTSILVPPGVVHAFTSLGPARFLNVHAPSCDFPEYLRRLDAGERFDTAPYDVFELG
jgi:thiamine monophosphate synthase/quercetin dioxygenase-like cupin family protein